MHPIKLCFRKVNSVSLGGFFNTKILAACCLVWFPPRPLPYHLRMGDFQVSGGWDVKLFIKLSVHVFPAKKAHWVPYASSKRQSEAIVLNTRTDASPGTNSDTFCCFPQHAGYVWLGIQIYYSYQTQLASSNILVRSLFCHLQASHIPSVYLEFKINLKYAIYFLT